MPTLLEAAFMRRGDNLLCFGLGRPRQNPLGRRDRSRMDLSPSTSGALRPGFPFGRQLLVARRDLKLPQAINRLQRFDAIVLDNMGYVQQSSTSSPNATRKTPWSSPPTWSSPSGTQIFKDPMTTMATADRLVHHATILEFTGESVRAGAAKLRQK